MHVIVDGYNFIFVNARQHGEFDGATLQSAREALLSLMTEYQTARMNAKITVIFDGGEGGLGLPRKRHVSGITVVFSDPDEDADAEIERAIAAEGSPRDATLVSSDRELTGFAKHVGAKCVASRDFYRLVLRSLQQAGTEAHGEPASKYDGPSEAEIAYWQHVFGGLETGGT